jgi:ABC-type transporter Mla MlaB component
LLADGLRVTLAGMEKEQLLKTLEDLRADLSQTKRVDPETVALLEDLTQEIRRAVDQCEQDAAPDVEPASSGLKDLLLKFEAEHPQLSVSIGRVADALAAMGI